MIKPVDKFRARRFGVWICPHCDAPNLIIETNYVKGEKYGEFYRMCGECKQQDKEES